MFSARDCYIKAKPVTNGLSDIDFADDMSILELQATTSRNPEPSEGERLPGQPKINTEK